MLSREEFILEGPASVLRTRPGLRHCSNSRHDGSSCYGPARPLPSLAAHLLMLADPVRYDVVPRRQPRP